ncbi:MAG: DEAD/DEAH box helicase [Candidatus Hodarchaeales archaeon]
MPDLDQFDQFTLKKWQKLALSAWLEKEQGVISAVPGSGKTHLALALMILFPESSFLVVVPSQELAKQWFRRIKETTKRYPSYIGQDHSFSITKTTVEIVNTVIKRDEPFEKDLVDFIIYDEVHRYCGFKFRKVLSLPTSKPIYDKGRRIEGYRGKIGLTATVPNQALQYLDYQLIVRNVGPIAYNYTVSEALTDQNIVPYVLYIKKVQLTDDEQIQLDETQRNIDKTKTILRSKLARKGIELNIGVLLRRKLPPEYNIPEVKYLRKLYLERRHLQFKARNKIYNAVITAKDLLNHPESHTIIFTMTIEVAEDIAGQLQPEAEIMHSKRNIDDNQSALERFREKFTRILVVVRTVDEGVDLPTLTHALIVANSKQIRQMIQRVGRILRVNPDTDEKSFASIFIFEVPGDEFDIDELKDSAMDVQIEYI